jgi:iron complex outermembrane receptor protein
MSSKNAFGFGLLSCSLPGLLAGLFSTAIFAEPSEDSGGAVLEEVVVTAQKRTERLLDVPISVTALSGPQLAEAGVQTSLNLGQVVPGLTMIETGLYVQPAIRGVTNTYTSPSAEPNVATYVDGVYQGNMTYAIYEEPDIQRVEVLKGPQGTLFGRNATGGAIQIFTEEPSFTPTGHFSAGYGSWNEKIASAFVSGPLIADRLAASITVYHRNNDGFNHDLLSDGNETGAMEIDLVRAKLLFDIPDIVQLEFGTMYADNYDYGAVQNTNLNGNNLSRAIDPAAPLASQPQQVSQNAVSYLDMQSWVWSIRARSDLPWGQLTSLSAYNDVNNHIPSDGDYSPLPILAYNVNTYTKAFSEELTFSSKQFGPLQFVAGLFYYYKNGAYDPLVISATGSAPFQLVTRDTTTAYAIFTEFHYDITDRLSVIAGARVNRETQVARAGFVNPPIEFGQVTNTRVTPRFSTIYALNDATRAYFTFSDGFKSGLYNSQSYPLAPAANVNPVSPETVTAYEVGIKYEPNSMPLRLHGALFDNDYKNLQVSALENVAGQSGVSVLQNAASVRSYGFDGDATWAASRDLSLVFGASWLHSKYSSFPDAAVDEPPPPPAPQNAGNVQATVDATGNWTIRSPEWTFNTTLNYAHDFAFGKLGVSGNLFFSSRVYFTPDDRIATGSYELLNLRTTWQPPGSRFRVGLWTRNLTGAKVINSTTITTFGDSVIYLPPRSVGGDVSYSF